MVKTESVPCTTETGVVPLGHLRWVSSPPLRTSTLTIRQSAIGTGLNVIAICDHKLRFSYMAVAGTGRTNDNRAILQLHELLDWIDKLPPTMFPHWGQSLLSNKQYVGAIHWSTKNKAIQASVQLLPLSTPHPDRNGVRSDDYQVAHLSSYN
jgi:hypothetical protein